MVKEQVSDTSERSLYDCYHARVSGDRIYCQKGHPFHENGRQNGSISLHRLVKGAPLVMSICQECADFESMGEALSPEERGWLRLGGNPKLYGGRVAWQKSLVR